MVLDPSPPPLGDRCHIIQIGFFLRSPFSCTLPYYICIWFWNLWHQEGVDRSLFIQIGLFCRSLFSLTSCWYHHNKYPLTEEITLWKIWISRLNLFSQMLLWKYWTPKSVVHFCVPGIPTFFKIRKNRMNLEIQKNSSLFSSVSGTVHDSVTLHHPADINKDLDINKQVSFRTQRSLLYVPFLPYLCT